MDINPRGEGGEKEIDGNSPLSTASSFFSLSLPPPAIELILSMKPPPLLLEDSVVSEDLESPPVNLLSRSDMLMAGVSS